jgi:hypothetical protein
MKRKPIAVLSLLAAAATAHADVIYSNTNGPVLTNFNSGNVLVGDEINFAGTARQLSKFDLQVYSISLGGGEQARVTLYANDGIAYNGYANRPSTVLWTSDWFTLSGGLVPAATGSKWTWSVEDSNLPSNIVLPNRITLAIEFSGIGVGESAGVMIFDPPTTGYSLDDYWEYNGVDDWHVKTNEFVTFNFASSVQAVPEPSFWALTVVGGLCGFFLMRRRRK